jgi:glycosyltransferase involved in cell wall biosynthesis
MKIAVFHNLPSGGAKRALYEWTKRLADSHQIDVFTLSTSDHDFCDIRPIVQNHHVYKFVPRKLFGSPLGRLNQLQRWRDLNDLNRLHQDIARQINSGNYDLLFAHPDTFTLIPQLLRYIDIPTVYYLHEPFGPGFVRQFGEAKVNGKSWRKKLDRLDPLIWLYHGRLKNVRNLSIQKPDLLLSNSEFTREVIHKVYEVDAPVCHYGVNLDSFRPMQNVVRRDDFVLSVGELSPRKGFDFIVESLGHIPVQKRPPLIIASNTVDNYELNHVQTLAENKGVNMTVLSRLNTDQLAVLYNQARLCVYAPVQEPFGLVPLEAMACGTPVLGVREGGVQESVIHEYTGLLVERDSQKFSAAIQHLLANPDLLAIYGRNGREYVVQNWTWERSVSTLTSYLEKYAGVSR